MQPSSLGSSPTLDAALKAERAAIYHARASFDVDTRDGHRYETALAAGNDAAFRHPCRTYRHMRRSIEEAFVRVGCGGRLGLRREAACGEACDPNVTWRVSWLRR